MKNLVTYYLFFLLFAGHAYSQTNSVEINGSIIDKNNVAIEFVNIVIQSAKDSSIIVGRNFPSGNFNFSDIEQVAFLVSISRIGYLDTTLFIQANDRRKIDLGAIMLNEFTLQAVTVTAKKPNIILKNDKMVMNVKGTFLSEAGTALDVLKKSPGVIFVGGKLQVLGKGSPMILINGRKVHLQSELNMIQSSNIEKIEIIDDPSAKYDASAQSVINIIQKKRVKGLSLAFHTDLEHGRDFSDETGVEISLIRKKINTYLNYSYADYRRKPFEEYILETNLNNNVSLVNAEKNNIVHGNTHSYILGSEIKINKKNSLEFQYLGQFDNTNIVSNGINKVNNNDIEFKTNSLSDESQNNNSFNLIYRFSPNKTSHFTIISSYGSFTIEDNSETLEHRTHDGITQTYKTFIKNKSEYNIPTVDMAFSSSLKNKLKYELGLKYSTVKNRNATTVSREFHDILTPNYELNEQILAFYAVARKKIGKVKVKGGARLEMIESNGILNSVENDDIHKNNIKLFPNISLSTPLSKNAKLSASYSQKIQRPSYSDLNPTKFYIDSLFYRIGNPKLKPTIINTFSLNLILWKKLVLKSSYHYRTNQTGLHLSNDPIDPKITKIIQVNYPSSTKMGALVGIFKHTKTFSYTLLSGFSVHDISIMENEQLRAVKNTSWVANINLEALVFSGIKASLNFTANRSVKGIALFEPKYELSASLRKSFLKNNLLLSLSGENILQLAQDRYSWNLSNRNIHHIWDGDNTYVKLRASYNINKFKKIFREKSSQKNEKSRI